MGFLSPEQTFGEPFSAQLQRYGLWSTQLFVPFEDAGTTEMNFLVFPQPLMADIGGHALATPIVRHGFTGFVETIAVRCLPVCSPNVLCSIRAL